MGGPVSGECIAALRPFAGEDAQAVLDLFYDTVHSVNAAHYSPAQLDAWAPKAQDAAVWTRPLLESHALVATEAGDVIGFGNIFAGGALDRLFVHRDCQGQGVGTALADALEQWAVLQGAKTIRTYASITARPFFLQRGYRVLKENHVLRAGQTLTNYLMEKVI